MNYINSIWIGNLTDTGTRVSARHIRRMLWLWLVKVIGWVDQEKSGSNWDNAQLTGTDGATDSSDTTLFNSATGGFTDAMEGSFLMVCPTSPPTTTGGFTDATRNGFYRIVARLSDTQIKVEIYNGVHTDGLPLSETGLNFEIHRFQETGNLPGTSDWFTVRGTGIGGTFDMKSQEDSNGYTNFTLSPFADWGSGDWSRSDRLIQTVTVSHDSLPGAWVFGIGDLTHFILYIAHSTTAGKYNTIRTLYYIGDIDRFHASDDPRPVVALGNSVGDSYYTYTMYDFCSSSPDGKGIYALGYDDTSQVGMSCALLCDDSYTTSTTTRLLDATSESRSFVSGRYINGPIIVCCSDSGYEEIRGTFKNLWQGHKYGKILVQPFGTNLDRLALGELVISWNGSRVYRYLGQAS